VCCTLLLAAGIGPRIALLFVWIFGDRVEHAFDSWVWPLLGLLFLPWTTLAYVFAWGPADGVSGWGWVLVGVGIALDIATYSSRAVRRGQQTA
jgi:hypothetical protein